MKKFNCICHEVVFFDNSQCVSCSRELGFCPVCQQLVALIGDDASGLRCSNTVCGAELHKCHNYRAEGVCNRCIASANRPNDKFCDCCRFNAVIPDLSKGDNRVKWLRLEKAKRRVFYDLDLLGLPRGNAKDDFDPPLSFEFKESVIAQPYVQGGYESSALLEGSEIVMTGHFNGKITINLHEADPVEREKLRVQFGERNRSLVGHFRHEMAHYYWDLLVRNKCETSFIDVFGDHNSPTYSEAITNFYNQGPPLNWRQHYTTAYASMHPWEDFAETFMTFLEIVSVLDTAHHMGLNSGGAFSPHTDIGQMVGQFIRLGTILNEINRGMGLKDLLVRSLEGPVIDKMRYIQALVNQAGETERTANTYEH